MKIFILKYFFLNILGYMRSYTKWSQALSFNFKNTLPENNNLVHQIGKFENYLKSF